MIPLQGKPLFADLAQLVRAFDSYSKGRRFKSFNRYNCRKRKNTMDTIYNVIANSPFQKLKEFKNIILLEVVDPIFTLFVSNETMYLVYLLRDQTVYNNNNKLNIKEILISESNIENIKKLINNELTIYETLYLSDSNIRIGEIGNKQFKPIIVNNISEINDRIPVEDLYLNLSDYRKAQVKMLIQS